jgi:hypothetical protein
MRRCERCGISATGPYQLLDYCATCAKNLCTICMTRGCCGKVPAESGSEADAEPLENEE